MTERLNGHRVVHRSISPSLIPTKTRPTSLAHPYVLPNQFEEPLLVYKPGLAGSHFPQINWWQKIVTKVFALSTDAVYSSTQ